MITAVPANVFAHLNLLNSLELEGNKIVTIDKEAFNGLEGKQENILAFQTQKQKKIPLILFDKSRNIFLEDFSSNISNHLLNFFKNI